MKISIIKNSQNQFFKTGNTLPWNFRQQQLLTLKNLLKTYQDRIIKALKKDLNKSEFEAISSEMLIIMNELNYFLKNTKQWLKPKKTRYWMSLDGKGEVIQNPFGTVLIIGAWNYPVQLTMLPLIAAISAGNCAVIKLPPEAPTVSNVLEEMINNHFDSNYLYAAGSNIHAEEILNLEFDKIFFTGSPRIGKMIMKKASETLTPITLELGGKSPAVIDKINTADLEKSMKRIFWGKLLNSGQTCIAPDYILLHKSIEKEFYRLIPKIITKLNIEHTMYKIINQRHFERISGYLNECSILFGGKTNPLDHSIGFTIVKPNKLDSAIMKEEIFGPILPIVVFEDHYQAVQLVETIGNHPLALYIFSIDKNFINHCLCHLTFGGAGINDTVSHILNPNLPFGGVKTSGMGRYHGKSGFECFSRPTSVFRKGFVFELPFRYPPYEKKTSLLKHLYNLLSTIQNIR
ncbi:MAG: aldehyde dehydrogenase family protein [Brevinemataceae bacterium]